MKAIFSEVSSARQHQGAEMVSFSSMESAMHKRRKLSWPPAPTNFSEIREALNQANLLNIEPGEPFYRAAIETESNGNAILFASQYQLSLLSGAQDAMIDATFKTVPKVGYQLLTIMVKRGAIAFPACFALMSTKQEGLYQEVLNSVKGLAPHFSPNTIMTDFEGALRNSLNQAFNTSSILGCWFHFTQAVRRKMQSLGLANVIEDEEGAHYLIKKVMCLPLLPAESIPDGLNQIMEENESLTLYPLFGYINRFWLRQIGAEQLSLYNRPFRTNNAIESFHSRLKRIMGVHPNIYIFVQKLIQIANEVKMDCNRLARGLAIARKKKTKYVLHDRQLQLCQDRLDAGVYSIAEFLNAAKYHIGRFIPSGPLPSVGSQNDEDSSSEVIDDIQEEQSHEEDDEGPERDGNVDEDVEGSENEERIEVEVVEDESEVCVVCLVQRKDGLALVPCGHQQFCRRCIEAFYCEDDGGHCPICRSDITQTLRLF